MPRPTSGFRRSTLSLRRSSVEATDSIERSAKQIEAALLALRVVIVLAMLGLSFYFVGNDIVKFYRRDTITGVTVDLLPNVTFPAVTICNYNRWKRSLISETDMSSLVQQMKAESDSNVAQVDEDIFPFDDYLTTDIANQPDYYTTSSPISSNVNTASDNSSSSDSSSSSSSSGGGAGATSTPSYSTSGATANSTRKAGDGFNLYNFTRNSGWRLVDFNSSARSFNGSTLLSCTFRGVDCDTRFFTKITTEFGNCYTFNKNINWTTVPLSAKRRLPYPLIQTVPHEDTGLSLSINVEAWDYYESTKINGNVQVGLKVIVHNADRVPNPSSEGIPISPGQHATIPVTWTEYAYMESPYGSCNASAKLEYFDTYSQEGCMWECIKKKVLEVCQCVVYYQANDTDNACDLSTSKSCAYKLIASIVNNPEVNCTCPVACTEASYDSTAYYANAPSDSMGPGLADEYNTSVESYRENVVSFDVYISKMAKTTVTQTPALTRDQVMANAGGWLGLFAGVSFVTFVELIEFAFERYFAKKEEEKEKPTTSRIKVHPIELKPQ